MPQAAEEEAETPVETMSFEAALAELERVVGALEGGEVPLEESIALYARGEALRKHCQKKLEEAEMRVAQITEGPGGRVGAKPVDLG
jgi:exodeoxyribonuclease VII small subunit